MYYAIEKIGARVVRYAIKRVTETGLVIPTDRKAYRTEEAARAAAAAAGIEIAKCGDLYEII